jgi:hypothetical protein
LTIQRCTIYFSLPNFFAKKFRKKLFQLYVSTIMTLRMNESDSQQLTEQFSGQVNVNVSKGMSDSESDSDSESESESEILRNYSNSCHHSVND